MDTASSVLPLSSYFRHRTDTGPPPMPSMTGIIVGPPSISSSALITSSIVTSRSSSYSSTVTFIASPSPSLSSTSNASSAAGRVSSSLASTFDGSLATGYGNPSASANSSSDTSHPTKAYSSSGLAVLCVAITFALLGITLWLGKKCCIDRARLREQQDANDENKKRYSEATGSGWANRLTFTGNREKFWHRLDDYHDSLRAREEGRLGPGQVVGGVVGKKRRSRMAPELMSMRMSAVPTFTHHRSTSNTPKLPQQQLGQTYNHGTGTVHGSGAQQDPGLKNDDSSVKTFMIGNDDELAYLSTMIDDKNPHSQYPQSQSRQQQESLEIQAQNQPFPVPSVSGAAPTPYDAPVGSYQLTQEDVGNAVTTSIPASSSREKISTLSYSFSNGPDHHKRLSTISTMSTVGNAMLSSVAGSINEKPSEKKKPSQHLSTASTYLTPNYVPPAQTEGRPQTDYRSPTESIYGCYKEDDDRHASFISTTGTTGGRGSVASGNVPAVPPIPAVYRQ